MDDLQLIDKLKVNYSEKDLNEAETRFKIIDTILHDVLKWPKDNISVEKRIFGNRADYVLCKDEKYLLVIESKKSGKYFELPQNFNGSALYQKIPIEKLLTNKHIKSSLLQVKEYAEDILCNYAAICNGKVWIIFRVNTSNKPWKSLPAIVIKDLQFFKDEFIYAINLLGYTSVISTNSLQNNVGMSKKVYPEIFYPKNEITTYNTPVNSNNYASSLNILSRKYLGIISEKDSEFMNSCYVSNRGSHNNIHTQIKSLIIDSLTPFFKNEGVRDFTDNKEGGAFGLRISQVIKQENLDNVMILFGGRGSGKSTFLKHLLYHERPIEFDMYSQIALIDLIDSSQTRNELIIELWKRLLNEIDNDLIRKGSREQIIELFNDDYLIYHKQFLAGLSESSIEFQKLSNQFIKDKLKDVKEFCSRLSLRLKNKKKGLIVFLDNMDQLTPELQDTCFLTAIEIAKKLRCLVIISMREERYFNVKTRGVLDAYHTPGFHLSSPDIPSVIIKRIKYIVRKIKKSSDIQSEYDLSENTLKLLISFFNICIKDLENNNSPLSTFLRFATQGDVRQALEFFKSFLTSGYTNINEMALKPTWVFKLHQVIKPMMIPNRFFYDERVSRIPNLYQLRNDTNSSHFTGLRILNKLKNRSGDKTTSGFIDIKFFIQEFELKYDLKEDCEKHLDIYLQRGLIEASNRLEEYSERVDQIRLTAMGNYMIEHLVYDFVYLDLIGIDCALYDEELSNFFVSTANKEIKYWDNKDTISRIDLRINRVERFIGYLIKQEEEEIIDLNISHSETKFSSKLVDAFEYQKREVLRSASNKLKNF